MKICCCQKHFVAVFQVITVRPFLWCDLQSEHKCFSASTLHNNTLYASISAVSIYRKGADILLKTMTPFSIRPSSISSRYPEGWIQPLFGEHLYPPSHSQSLSSQRSWYVIAATPADTMPIRVPISNSTLRSLVNKTLRCLNSLTYS